MDKLMEQYVVVGQGYKFMDGIYLIDHDDPELLQYGELGVHEGLSSHLADLLKTPKDPMAYEKSEEYAPHLPLEQRQAVIDVMYKYFEHSFFSNLDAGYQPSIGLLVEIFRQSRGFPYEWVGAEIE